MLRRSLVIATTAAIVFPIALAACTKRDRNGTTAVTASSSIDTTVGHAPAGVRIKVEVLNASNVHGAARLATLLLRERGYDVVAIGNAHQNQDATVVLDRSRHPEWAQLIAKAIGGEATSRPDTSEYLDATVILGAHWTPPPMPFHP